VSRSVIRREGKAMVSIVSNVGASVTLRELNRTSASMTRTMERLTTGLRINRASEDPSGLVISEKLRSQISGLNRALQNTQNDINLINTAESGLSQIADVLIEIRASIISAMNTGFSSPDQIQAEQDKIDQSLAAIDRIATTTKFGQRGLLNGQSDFLIDQSANHLGSIADMQVRQTRLSASSLTQRYSVNVTAIAERATLVTNTNFNSTAGITSLSTGGNAGDLATLRITGGRGTEDVILSADATVQDLIVGINTRSSLTGVFASSYRPLPFEANTFEMTFAGTAGVTPGFAVQSGASFVVALGANDTNTTVIVSDTDRDGVLGVAELNAALSPLGVTAGTTDGAGAVGDIRLTSSSAFSLQPVSDVRTLRLSASALSSRVNDASGTTAGQFEVNFDLNGDGVADFAVTTAAGTANGALDTASEQAALLAQINPNLPANMAAYFDSTTGDLVFVDLGATLNTGGQGAGILNVAGDDVSASLLGNTQVESLNAGGMTAFGLTANGATASERAIEFANFAVASAHMTEDGLLAIDTSLTSNAANFQFNISNPETGLMTLVQAAPGADGRVSIDELRAALRAAAGTNFDVFFSREKGLTFVNSNAGPLGSTFHVANVSGADNDLAEVTGEGAKSSSSNALRLTLYSTEFGSGIGIRLEDVTGAGSGLALSGVNSGGIAVTSAGRNGLGVMAGVGSQLASIRGININAIGSDAAGSVNGIDFNARGFEVAIIKPSVDLRFRLQDTWGRHGETGARADAVSFGFADRVGGTQLTTRYAGETSLGGNALDTFEFVVRQGVENGVVQSSGLRFQIRESDGVGDSMNIGLRSVTTASLGMDLASESENPADAANNGSLLGGRLSTLATGSGNDLFQNPENALRIVDMAIDQISDTRAFIGSVARDHLQRNMDGITASLESHTESESAIRDIDFANETSELARLQVLYAASVSVLATANSMPSQVLQLIRS